MFWPWNGEDNGKYSEDNGKYSEDNGKYSEENERIVTTMVGTKQH